MLDQINEMIKKALKSRDKFSVNTFKLIKNELIKEEKTTGKKRSDIDVIKSYYRRLDKALSAYVNFPDRYEVLQKELSIIKSLLPEGPDMDEVKICAKNILLLFLHSAEEDNQNPMKVKGKVISAVKKYFPDADFKELVKYLDTRIKKSSAWRSYADSNNDK